MAKIPTAKFSDEDNNIAGLAYRIVSFLRTERALEPDVQG